ncbi:TlpA disulfide reductase family protein [Tissierella sp. Yu-01]|uniref:TlpA family protein disulfide reductase n=1 Tax=Tissierella sp. Yu-01 TaxID=3035694 RepID=UPI00240D1A0D|nr:TlpA disulfide reductase family protein [Tissierella sp. Yu-01]WFA08256.1 TlpA disulfide reductase family protein [Tissierella sp. Yu-01]
MKYKILALLMAVIVLLVGCSTGNISESEQPEVIESEDSGEEQVSKEEVVVEAPVDEPVEETSTEIAKDKPAPDFTLMNLSGEEVSLSDYRGKIVLINFWATWCTFCDMEMPDLQRLDDENDDLVVLAVDVMEDKETVEKYINEGGYSFEVVLDEKGDVTKTYLVSGFPTSYFVDPDGILLGGVPGMMTYDQMNQILDDIR